MRPQAVFHPAPGACPDAAAFYPVTGSRSMPPRRHAFRLCDCMDDDDGGDDLDDADDKPPRRPRPYPGMPRWWLGKPHLAAGRLIVRVS
jgi:hypothetical protein